MIKNRRAFIVGLKSLTLSNKEIIFLKNNSDGYGQNLYPQILINFFKFLNNFCAFLGVFCCFSLFLATTNKNKQHLNC